MNTPSESASVDQQAVRAAFTPPPPFADPEKAAEAGRRSGAARKRRAEMSPEERALDSIGNKLGELTDELIQAALGEGDFEALKLDTRVTALTRLMEWRLGRPSAVKSQESEPDESTVPQDGEALFK